MQNIPVSVWIGLVCLALGGLGGGALVLRLAPTFNVSVTPTVTPSSSITPSSADLSVLDYTYQLKIPD